MITPLSRRKESTYSDFLKDFSLNQTNFDLGMRNDEESIKESIRNLINTNRGERLFQPNIGSDISKYLFENLTPDVEVTLRDMIAETINTYEPRASLIGVDILSDMEGNYLEATIVFNIINSESPVTLNVSLERIR